MRQKRGSWDEDAFVHAVKTNKNIADVLKVIGCDEIKQGSVYRKFHSEVLRLGLDISHFDPWHNAKRRGSKIRKPLIDVLVENSNYDRASLKTRLVEENLLEYRCSKCDVVEWCDEKLSLHLDHINGINNDNRLENLRLLCPNCHSQTSTYCGRNASEIYSKSRDEAKSLSKLICPDCKSSKKDKYSFRCAICSAKKSCKIIWPTYTDLKLMVWEMPTQQLAKLLGVSDVAIAKHCKKLGIEKPPRGHWRIKETQKQI